MSAAFIPQFVRGIRSFPSPRLVHTALTRHGPTHIAVSHRVRMQCTPTGEVPEMTENIVKNMERKINDALTPTRLHIVPTVGDPNGAHVAIEVVSEQFQGMAAVKRHQAVYKAIWEELSVS